MEPLLHKLCGTRHWSKEPCPAMKSTATRKDVRGIEGKDRVSRSPALTPHPPMADAPIAVDQAEPVAGTQAQPVDTKSKRGRPSTGFDKKAHDRERARLRRAEAKKSTNLPGASSSSLPRQ